LQRRKTCSTRTTGPTRRAARRISRGLHAAQALIFESTGKAIKRHSGVQREFARLVKDEPRFDMDLRAFLLRSNYLKAIADYETGPGSQVSAGRAREAIQTVRRFVKCVAGLIPANGSAPEAEPKP
jgi:uncharacterized protein (UPF0332 family)